ncbi:hypothetical protein LIER_14740 [Lithospermum erythrorhizon]|uniref:Reverse transcriptase domain-containing protein n=1 Tax=Lithospermum erythrorhizon TaxID=34254 RepID=A0AAV3Q2H9_LITER
MLVDFPDAFQGYHHIFMDEEDMEKTTFVIEYGIYCWKVMAFGLKNAGATYQRIVNKVFSTQKGRNMEIYVDEILIKSREAADHEANLRESFENLRNQRGIEPNLDKIAALQAMQSPQTQKEVQGLAGRIAALAQFISRAGDRSLRLLQGYKERERLRIDSGV